MKVSGSAKNKTDGTPAQAAPGRGSGIAVAGASASSQSTFTEVAWDMEAHQILAELEDIGAQLSRFPAPVLLVKYKNLVRSALERVKNGMRIKREFKWRRTERSMFLTIERTEDALTELEDAITREGDRAKSLSLVEEIKGCLISLLF
ncbi:MAG: DUF327 family protein [Synergistaceae bacterium]|jgi:uncharacterized protein YaaR (DUF327 family)|nr:DUF327 family protein [Synergistaceae bacterium]